MPASRPAPTPDPAKHVVGVEVFYEDRVYQDPDWAELPDDGVQIILVRYTDGTCRRLEGNNWYFRARGLADWVYAETNDPADIDRYPDAVRVRGRWTDDATWAGLMGQASC